MNKNYLFYQILSEKNIYKFCNKTDLLIIYQEYT